MKRLPVLCALNLLLASCVTGGAATDTFCQIYSPITWSQADTDETVRQVKLNNARWAETC